VYTPNANFSDSSAEQEQTMHAILLSMLTLFSVVDIYGMKLWLPNVILCGKIALESILFSCSNLVFA